jgi:hypothetical protein
MSTGSLISSETSRNRNCRSTAVLQKPGNARLSRMDRRKQSQNRDSTHAIQTLRVCPFVFRERLRVPQRAIGELATERELVGMRQLNEGHGSRSVTGRLKLEEISETSQQKPSLPPRGREGAKYKSNNWALLPWDPMLAGKEVGLAVPGGSQCWRLQPASHSRFNCTLTSLAACGVVLCSHRARSPAGHHGLETSD